MQNNYYSPCFLCPRSCGINRSETTGFCGFGANPVVARASVHFWEEPCISGKNGSGTVFFSGCNLRCRFCQNRAISAEGFGIEITSDRLRQIFFELIDKGVNNINLVTPTHFVPSVIEAIGDGLPVPVVYNSGGYESVETLRLLEGKTDIYLPDFKYSDSEAARKYSLASDYPQKAKAAILEMFRQTGDYVIDENGIMTSGVIIRHLLLPGNLANTFGVIDWVKSTFKPGNVLFSLMGQFTPLYEVPGCPELMRRVTPEEYEEAQEYLFDSGIEDGFVQELSSADEKYVPDFDLSGIV